MNEMQLMMHLHLDTNRQGPGSDETTLAALALSRIDIDSPLKVADIGCGTGAQTLALAKKLKGEIVAVDMFGEFLCKLEERMKGEQLTADVRTLQCSMDNLPFSDGELDMIWSEGAVYNIGFRNGVTMWRRFLKPGGILAVSEITWTTGERPEELDAFWRGEYPETDTASAKIKVLEDAGYRVLAHFILPENCWTDNYYVPLLKSHARFLERYGSDKTAHDIVALDMQEVEFYSRYKDYYSYGFYIAEKI